MNVSGTFIRRPVATTMLMSALVLFGWFAYRSLPVAELPSVDFPTISVSANLPGADPQTMAATVATPLERAFTQIAGVDSMTSSSGMGTTGITLQFALDRDIDAAAQDVQTAISQAARQLPAAMPSPPVPGSVPSRFRRRRADPSGRTAREQRARRRQSQPRRYPRSASTDSAE